MMKFLLRLGLLGLGAWLLYTFGGYMVKTIWYRASGEVVEGRVSGFLAGRYGATIQEKSTAIRGGRLKARRPAFQYPIAAGATDSLEGRSKLGVLFTFSQYEMNERVTVVFAKNQPKDAYIFGWELIFVNLLLSLFAAYMMSMGIRGKA